MSVNSPGTVGWHAAHAAVLRHAKDATMLLRSAHALANHHDGEADVGALRDEDRFTLASRIEEMLQDPSDAEAVASMEAASMAAAPSLTVSSVGDGLMLVGSRTLFVFGVVTEKKMLRLAALLRAIDNDYTDGLWKYLSQPVNPPKYLSQPVKPPNKRSRSGDSADTTDEEFSDEDMAKNGDSDEEVQPKVPMARKQQGEIYGPLATIFGMQESKDVTPKDPRRLGPLHIQISSSGGEVYPTMGLLDVMDAMTLPIVTHCMGKAFSAGAVLLMGGDRRLMGPHSFVLFHEARLGAFGPSSRIDERLDNVGLAEDEMIRLLVTRTKMVEGWEEEGHMAEFYSHYSLEGLVPIHVNMLNEWMDRPNMVNGGGPIPRMTWAFSLLDDPSPQTMDKCIKTGALNALKAKDPDDLIKKLSSFIVERLKDKQDEQGIPFDLPPMANRLYKWYVAWQRVGKEFPVNLDEIKEVLLQEYIQALMQGGPKRDKKKWYDEGFSSKMSTVGKRMRDLLKADIFLSADACFELGIITHKPVKHSAMYAALKQRSEKKVMKADVGRLEQMRKRFQDTNILY